VYVHLKESTSYKKPEKESAVDRKRVQYAEGKVGG